MKICIDAGHNHSGWDTGASYGGIREQDITYSIAKKLSGILAQYGIGVVETRSVQSKNLGTDLNSSLNARSNLANANKADYFVSIHCNANANLTAKGTETYVQAMGGKAEQMAACVNLSLCNAIGTVNRGVKAQNLAVLRNTAMPAILVETAFLSNEQDRAILVNKQEAIASGIAAGITKYLGVKKVNKYSYDDTVDALISKGITSVENMVHWEKCLDGREPLDKNQVRILLNRCLERI